ncbi:MAG: dihydrofolate reductase family protein [Archangium sp.]
MRPIRYSINVTLDGCVDHRAGVADPEVHRHATEGIARADGIILGRTTYELMETGWRTPSPDLPEWTRPFAKVITQTKKYVVSSTLPKVDWTNAELVRGELGPAIRALKEQPGGSLALGGVKLPLALAELGLIDEFEFFVMPRIAGHGPSLFGGLSKYLALKLIGRTEYPTGAVALRYEPR